MQPAVRGTFPKFLWASVKRLESDVGARMRAGFPDTLRQRIREVPRLGWADASLFAETCDSLQLLGGREGAFAAWHRCCTDSIDLPLVRPLAKGAVTLFGTTPGALVRRTGTLWSLLSRGCGAMGAHELGEPDAVRFVAQGLPPVLRTPSFLVMFEAGFHSQLDMLGYEGSVEVDGNALAVGDVRCVVRWGKQARRPSHSASLRP